MKEKVIYYFFYDMDEYRAYKPFVIGLSIISLVSFFVSLSAFLRL